MFLDDKSTLPCHYTGPAFKDKDLKHIITGHLRIININYAKCYLKVQITVKIDLLIIKRLRKA